MRRLTVVLGLVAVLLGLAAAPALASPPMALPGQLTDQAGVLDAGQQQQVQTALDNLRRRTGTRLYIAYVPSFSGLEGKVWAGQTAGQSALGPDDVLLAVAVSERLYGLHVGTDVSNDQVLSVFNGTVKRDLSAGEWAGAAIAMAGGLASGNSGSHTGLIALGVVVAIIVLAGAGYLLFRWRRARSRPAAITGPKPAPDPYPGTPTAELNARASTALLDIDERVRTAQVNLDYARSYYGEDAVPGFAGELSRAQDELARAFTIRQQLDDDVPEDAPTTRRMLAALLRLTGDADARLRAQTDAVEELRRREANAPQALDALDRRIAALKQRLPLEQQRLTDLAGRYAPSALAPVADNVDHAGVRLSAAEQALAAAREDQAAGRTGKAVGRLRPAEEAVTQSGTLLDAIGRAAEDLAAAEQRIPAARADTEADLAEARAQVAAGDGAGRAGPGDRTGLQAQVARAEAALVSAGTALHPADGALPDPLAALRRLEQAGGDLRQALQHARDAQTQARKAAAALDQALLTARSAVAAAGDFISTRRGAVGPEARTRLAEAQRHLDAATGQGRQDPVAALRDAQRADQLAEYALRVAQDDVEQWSQRTGYGWGGYRGPGVGYGPGYGAGYGYGRRGSGLGWGLGGLLLGGLLFGDRDRGDWGADGGADWGGGFGGSDFGGGFGGGGDFGGGFGGSDSGGSF